MSISLVANPLGGLGDPDLEGRCFGCGERTDWINLGMFECQRCQSLMVARKEKLFKEVEEKRAKYREKKLAEEKERLRTTTKKSLFSDTALYETEAEPVTYVSLYASLNKKTDPFAAPGPDKIYLHLCAQAHRYFFCPDCRQEGCRKAIAPGAAMPSFPWRPGTPAKDRHLPWVDENNRVTMAATFGVVYKKLCDCNRCGLGRSG